ncbi:MAG: pyruvate dehydrogenase (acetyl-transferring) E1 component subunit alpha [Bacteroides sp.]|nr:MAG: pyruvate dehydrogenase (acetyl-transferring) E1 component subunit alpha [Bacteroides sp.]
MCKYIPILDYKIYANWYESMLLMRKFEEKSGQLYGQQKIKGFCHLYIGQEAIVAGSMSAIDFKDPVITSYRDHAHAIGKGVDPKHIMAELYGKITGCCKGKGGSMHIFSKKHYFFGGHGIVGGQIPLGAGIAMAAKYKNSKQVCLCFLGDGAVRQGVFNETLNMSILWKLPVIFICENNGYAMGTSINKTTNTTDIYQIGKYYGINSFKVDGMCCESVHSVIKNVVDNARSGAGPALIEAKTYRYKGHSMSDPAKYRTREELNFYKNLDPIEKIKNIIINKFNNVDFIEKIEKKVIKIIEESVSFAENSSMPSEEELYKDVYVQKNYPFI